MKKILWTALAAVVTAAAATSALRLLRYVWREVTQEEPPEQPRWARMLVGAPLNKRVTKAIESAAG